VFIEMIDLLRCVNEHEDTWLVASFREITNRIVIQGTLGCPVCSAEYEISNGVADFTLGEPVLSREHNVAAETDSNEELATRAGAFLDATQPGATIVLGGSWASAAQQLAEMADVRVIALNAPAGVKESERVGLVRVAKRIPLAANSVHGVALDASFPPSALEAALRSVRPGGRVVGPASSDAPNQSAVLARNETHWVAEKPAEMIPIRRSKQ
jgi:hypothetical protein